VKILVRGGTGFCGRHVVWRALQSGHEVAFTGRNAEAAKDVAAFALRLGFERPQFVPEAHSRGWNAEAVVNCAGHTGLGFDAAIHEAANVAYATRAFDEAAGLGALIFVHVSSSSALFENKPQPLMGDGVPAAPLGHHPYADSKARAEAALAARFGSATRIRIIRPRGIYGPFDTGVLPKLLEAGRRFGGRLPLPAPEALASMTAASNLAHAILLAAEADSAKGDGVYNVSDGEDWTLSRLVSAAAEASGASLRPLACPRIALMGYAALDEALAKRLGREPGACRYSASLLCHERTLDIARIRRELGYAPLLTPSQAFSHLGKWHRSGVLSEYDIARPYHG
jgi:nucleoside-diphosphate-sugar epimerase